MLVFFHRNDLTSRRNSGPVLFKMAGALNTGDGGDGGDRGDAPAKNKEKFKKSGARHFADLSDPADHKKPGPVLFKMPVSGKPKQPILKIILLF
jgi:hypothetical protein